MSRFRRQVFTYSFQLVDLVLIVFSFGAATLPVLFRQGLPSFAEFLSMKIKLQNFVAFLLLVWLWRFTFSVLGLYNSKRRDSRKAEAMDVAKATSLCAVILVVFDVALSFRMVNAEFVAIFWASSTLLVAATRLTVRTWLRGYRARGHNNRNMLIVGTNSRAIEFARSIPRRPEWGCQVTGFADDQWVGVKDLVGIGARCGVGGDESSGEAEY